MTIYLLVFCLLFMFSGIMTGFCLAARDYPATLLFLFLAICSIVAINNSLPN